MAGVPGTAVTTKRAPLCIKCDDPTCGGYRNPTGTYACVFGGCGRMLHARCGGQLHPRCHDPYQRLCSEHVAAVGSRTRALSATHIGAQQGTAADAGAADAGAADTGAADTGSVGKGKGKGTGEGKGSGARVFRGGEQAGAGLSLPANNAMADAGSAPDARAMAGGDGASLSQRTGPSGLVPTAGVHGGTVTTEAAPTPTWTATEAPTQVPRRLTANNTPCRNWRMTCEDMDFILRWWRSNSDNRDFCTARGVVTEFGVAALSEALAAHAPDLGSLVSERTVKKKVAYIRKAARHLVRGGSCPAVPLVVLFAPCWAALNGAAACDRPCHLPLCSWGSGVALIAK